MTATIHEFNGDTYRPYRRHGDDDVTILADARMLKEIELFASHARQVTEHDFRPLAPDVRKKVLKVLAVLNDQPL
jgi:hypothetical protein